MKFLLIKKLPFLKKHVFIFFGIFLLVYFIIVSIHWGRVDSFNKAMIFFSLLWVIVSIKINTFYVFIKKLPKVAKLSIKIFLIAVLSTFVIVEFVIIYNMRTTATVNADYVIVLGCQVDGSIPSIPLMRRVYAAINYLKENQNTVVVVSGGQGPGENISEAEAMKRMLLQNGINENRIFEEDTSKSTMENFKFADALYNLLDKKIIVVTSDYHMFRAVSTAKKLGYSNIRALPGRSQLSVLPVYLLREYTAVMYYKLLGRI